MPDPRPGDRFGPFEIVESLGRGGNATVFRAAGPEGDAALKILNTRRVDSEPYARFRREIETLRELGDRPGILPLLEAELPETLGRGKRAWLAMPIATPIDEALAEAELPAIVEAVASIAATLADLHSSAGLAHRDIKPQNLYLLGETFAVGDFGLVALPDAEHLTSPGKVIGPANFVAYEMMENPLGADPAPADVYSLAKSLWVLIAGARWPPPGHQAAGQSPGVAAYRPHIHATAIDQLVDRATRFAPQARPSMAMFATDLETWLQLPPPAAPLSDLSALGAELRRRAVPHIEASADRERRIAAGYALYERFERRLEPFTASISESFPNVGSADGSLLVGLLGTTEAFGQPEVTSSWAAGATLREYSEIDPVLLRYGGLIELLDGHAVRVSTAIQLGHELTMGADTWLGQSGGAPVESLAAQTLVDGAVDELVEALPGWVQRFAAALA